MKKLYAIILSLGLIIAPVPVTNTAHAAGGSSLSQQLLGIANGVVGASLITKCTMASLQPSVLVYMAGSITYILGEITTAKKKSSDIGDLSQNLDQLKAGMVEGGDYQRKAIQSQLDNEQSNLNFVQKRKMFVGATLAIYAVATVLAMLEAWWELPTPAGLNKPSFAACTPNPASDQIWVLAIGGAYAALASSGGKPTAGGMVMGMGMSVAVAKLIPLIAGASIPAGVTSAMALNTAWSRIGFFVVVTALVGKIMSELSAEEKKIKERISKLQQILNSMPGTSNAVAENPTAPTGGKDGTDPTKTPGKTYGLKDLPKSTTLPKVCMGADKSVSEAACGGAKYQLVRPKLDANFGLGNLQNSTNVATDFSQAMIDGDHEKAELMAGQLQSAAVTAGKIKDALLKKHNDYLTAQGKKPVDLDALAKKELANMNANFAKHGFDSSGIGGAGSFADSANIGAAAVSETKPVEGAGEINAEGVSGDGTKAGGVDLSAVDAAGKDAGATDGALDPNAANNNQVASLSDSLDGYESSQGDISKERDVSIFKQVSNRYFLNYTRLFEKKKIDPPLAEPTP